MDEDRCLCMGCGGMFDWRKLLICPVCHPFAVELREGFKKAPPVPWKRPRFGRYYSREERLWNWLWGKAREMAWELSRS